MYRPLLWPCQRRCGTCRDWVEQECCSPERVGEHGGYGASAGRTSSRNTCEAWVNGGHAILSAERAAA